MGGAATGRVSVAIPDGTGRVRADRFVADVTGLSRAYVQRLIAEGRLTREGRAVRANVIVTPGPPLDLDIPEVRPLELEAESIPLQVVYEDEDLLVVITPAGMVTHPAPGHPGGTLVNALLGLGGPGTYGGIAGVARPGIVHRLDRDTSGLLLVAKTDSAYADLSRQVRRREIERRYLALVWGSVREDRLLINVPIGRHQRDRKRMAAVSGPPDGRVLRPASTDVTVLDRLGPIALVEAKLGTGRTHQIRVHLAHVGHPVVGDPVYGLRQARRQEAALPKDTLALVRQLRGQALHAHFLRFQHPARRQAVTFTAPMPPEMARLASHLTRADRFRQNISHGQEGAL